MVVTVGRRNANGTIELSEMDGGKVARPAIGAQLPAMAQKPTQEAEEGDASTPSRPNDGSIDGAISPAAAGAPARRGSFKRRHWGKLTVFTLLGLPITGFALWTFITLSWSYSSGQRAGYVQKISHKGFVCKTWEGTLYTDIAKGFRSDSFSFTVRSDSLAHVIEALSGKRVTMHYEQHISVPTSCFGETEYFVTKVQPIPE